MSVWRLFLYALIAAMAALSGCSEPPIEYTEVRRIDEQITEQELHSYLALAHQFPEKKLPEFPTVYSPPADWSHTRTLPVNELVHDEMIQILERWDVDFLAKKVEKNKELLEFLQEVRMTPRQYVGLTLALGAAYGKLLLRADQDLKTVIDEGDREIGRLKKIKKPFAIHREDEKYSILKRAMWLTRQNRAEQLLQVPKQNVALVERYQKELESILPIQFTVNPLDEVADLLREKGLPFEIIDGSSAEDEISWSPSTAIFGTDKPDEEFASHSPSLTPRGTGPRENSLAPVSLPNTDEVPRSATMENAPTTDSSTNGKNPTPATSADEISTDNDDSEGKPGTIEELPAPE